MPRGSLDGLAAHRFLSSPRKKKLISKPSTIPKRTAPRVLATPSSIPSTRPVRMIARTLMAGPE